MQMKQQVVEILKKIVDLSETDIHNLLETPPSREQGDVAFPCFTLAKTLRMAPPLIAQQLKDKVEGENLQAYGVQRVVQAGPYLNFFFERSSYTASLIQRKVTEQLDDVQIGKNKTVVVEYSSPNIAKHFQVYHIRSTMIGQALANIYQALGYHVERMNHLGDWGTQFGKLMAAYVRWGDEESVRQNPLTELNKLYVKFHEEAERQPELEAEGRLWFKKLEDGDEQAVRLWKWFKDESMKVFNSIYSLLNVTFDHYLGESYYSDKMDAVIQELNEKQLLEESDGALVVRLDEQHIPPCMIQKSDGTSIYATRDLAAAIYRAKRFDPCKILYVVDQRQSLHFQQVFSVLKKMGYTVADHCEHVSFGFMTIGGEMGSTRKGKGLLLDEVLNYAVEQARKTIEEKNPSLENKDEVARAIGIGAIVFNDLKHHRTHNIDFVWEEAFSFEGKTGPYVQYTHARICSLLRKAHAVELEAKAHAIYETDQAWEITYKLQQYPSVLVDASRNNDPSQVAKFLLDLCQLFNRFYANERFIVEDREEQNAKLLLAKKVAEILKHGLSMLTLQAPEAI